MGTVIHVAILTVLAVGLGYCAYGLAVCWREGRRRQRMYDRRQRIDAMYAREWARMFDECDFMDPQLKHDLNVVLDRKFFDDRIDEA